MIVKHSGPGSGYGADRGGEVDVEIVPVTIEGEELFIGEAELEPEIPFDANLAEFLDESDGNHIVKELEEALDADEQSRADWIRAYKDGLDLLGVKIEERSQPWDGACGVTHPMILESAVRFQSKASVRLFPSKGPAAVRVYGSQNEEVMEASRRVAADLNYYCTEKMSEYFADTETLLFHLPVAGSALRKVYFDSTLGRPCAHFVSATDFVMPAGFPNLETCPRYTELIRKSHSDVLRLADDGYYLPFDVSLLSTPDLSEAQDKEAQITGIRPSATHSELVTLCEMHVDFALEQFDERVLPYVVTWEKSTSKLLAIRRNWREGDRLQRKRLHYVHYRYVPGLDAYGWGLIHLIGGLAKGTTSILRQLVDAGTLSNLLGGFKSRQFRIKGEDKPIAPGEWRDVDLPGGKISEGLFPLPYKEPSTVLMNLYNQLVAEGKEFASIADLDISTASASAPVGTILALIERASEVITAVQARLHAAFKLELNLLADCIREYDSEEYDYEVEGKPKTVKKLDYGRRWQIRPVSDPSTATTAQRVMQYQAAMQFAQAAPQIYDIPKLHREMLANLGIDPPEDLVPENKAVPLDPVSENMAILTSKPIKAFEYQDHSSHIAVHMAAMQDQELQQMLSQSPLAASVQGAAAAHVSEHVALEYRKQIEEQMGVPLPPIGTPLPPEVEEQLASIQAQAAGKLTQKRAAEAQQKQAQAIENDPVFQLEKEKLELEKARLQQKDKKDQADAQIKAQQVGTQAQAAQATAQAQMAKSQADVQAMQMRTQADAQRGQLEMAKTQAEMQAILSQSAAQSETARSKAESERVRNQTQYDIELGRIASDRERADEEADVRREQTASQERMSRYQTDVQDASRRDDWRVEQEKLRQELREMRQQFEVAMSKMAVDQEKLEQGWEQLKIEREKLESQERQAAANRRAQREAAQRPAPEGGDATGET